MNQLFIAALMLSTLTTFGQELKKVTDTSAPSPFTNIKEEYYVLKEAKKVRSGPYKKWVNNKLAEEGYYKNNQKDSTWIRYGVNLNVLAIGNYAKDEKTGIWKYFLPGGELEQAYDYTDKKFVSVKADPSKTTYQVISGSDTTYEALSRPPTVIGGSSAYLEVIARNLRIPPSAFRRGANGRVYVRFIIDETGKASDFSVLKKGDKDLDAEAIRVVKLIEGWQPAMKGDTPVKVIHTIPISFL
jgi:TonB family protein